MTEGKDLVLWDNFSKHNIKENSGELGIRTPGGVTLNGFQDRRNRPLCQLSGAKVHFDKLLPKISLHVKK